MAVSNFMCPSQPLILNFLSRLIQILERERGEESVLREREGKRQSEEGWALKGVERCGGKGEKPFVAGGGSDLAKLKSLLYGRTGKIGYTPGGSR